MLVCRVPYLSMYKSTFYDRKISPKITLDLYTGHRQRPDPSNPRNQHNNCLKLETGSLDLYTGHRQRPDPSNPRNQHNNCLKSIGKTKFTKPVLTMFEFHQFSACSLQTKKFEIMNFTWLKQKPTEAYFYCIF